MPSRDTIAQWLESLGIMFENGGPLFLFFILINANINVWSVSHIYPSLNVNCNNSNFRILADSMNFRDIMCNHFCYHIQTCKYHITWTWKQWQTFLKLFCLFYKNLLKKHNYYYYIYFIISNIRFETIIALSEWII